MSTKTEHLGLHQWEPEDSFLRTDFNEDFAKIDAEAKAVRALAETVSAAGSYKAVSGVAAEPDLGFRPKLVVLLCGSCIGFVMDGLALRAQYQSEYTRTNVASISARLTDTGFWVAANEYCFNTSSRTTYYVAIR